jgi:hypothetical protein
MLTFPVIETHDDSLTIVTHGKQTHFTVKTLPTEFIEWQIAERMKVFQSLTRGGKPEFLAAHLPTLITFSREPNEFPLNVASKGVGLTPVEMDLPSLVNQLHSILKDLQNISHNSSLQKRLDAALLLYGNPEKIDRYRLGGLEIFETQSFSNILSDPRVSLFFVGGAPSYRSYQINCIAEIIDSSQLFYEFVLSMRGLFEQASFHFQQPKYPYAIKYHVIQVLDKSLQVCRR